MDVDARGGVAVDGGVGVDVDVNADALGSPARASYGASMFAPGSRYRSYENRCCQICPSRFITTLSFLEVSEDDKRRAWRNFASWHRQVFDNNLAAHQPRPGFGSRAKGIPDATAVAATAASTSGFVEVSANSDASERSRSSTREAADANTNEQDRPPEAGIRPIPPLYAIEPGPCCPICPTFFMNRYNDQRKEGSALLYHRQEGDSYWQSPTGSFVDLGAGSAAAAAADDGFGQPYADESGFNVGGGSGDVLSPLSSSSGSFRLGAPSVWRKKGRSPRASTSNNRVGVGGSGGTRLSTPAASSFVELDASARARARTRKIDFPELQCCNVCMSQFFPPLEYDDEVR